MKKQTAEELIKETKKIIEETDTDKFLEESEERTWVILTYMNMLPAFIELLVEKQIITREEWLSKMCERMHMTEAEFYEILERLEKKRKEGECDS